MPSVLHELQTHVFFFLKGTMNNLVVCPRHLDLDICEHDECTNTPFCLKCEGADGSCPVV